VVTSLNVLFYPAISLDGYIARGDGDSGFVHEEDERLFVEEVLNAGCVIVGIKTFKQYQAVIYPIKGAVNFVCTSNYQSLQMDESDGVRYVGGAVHSIVQQIQTAGFTSAVLSGGGDTNGRFAAAGAINEILVSIYPIVLGSGIGMFGSRQPDLNLQLIESRTIASGIIRHRYKVHRPT
jgi:dihydrofolate reductase